MEANYKSFGELVTRINNPAGVGPFPLFLLLHGLTGDENAMWVFASRLPKQAYLIAPRGIYPSSIKGYSWQLAERGIEATMDDFRMAYQALLELLVPSNFPDVDLSQIHIVGFSQGAALALSFLLLHPEIVCSAAGLAGFLPEGSSELAKNRPIQGKRVFIAHGTFDKQVPISRGRDAANTLELAGASVIFCEDEVGHKLSASCFRGLEAFFGGKRNC